MKKLLAIISSMVFSSASSAMPEKHEASMNFDPENVRPFLIELDTKFGLGLDIEKMVKFSESIEVEKEESIFLKISSEGGESTMEFHVFMDDIDAPDLYFFFEQAELANKVSNFMIEWAEARGM